MKENLVLASILFITMVFAPSSVNRVEVLPEKSEEVVYEEPSINVLNIYDGSVFPCPLDEYILGVVLAEMPASFEVEALKAQAVAARTYAVTRLNNPAHENADICMNASCCCAYIYPTLYEGDIELVKKVQGAVKATSGEILLYDNEPIVAAFHAMSAGKTEDAKNVWGGDAPYLSSVMSPLEERSENFITTATFSLSDFLSIIKSADPNNTATSFSDVALPTYTDSGYVKEIKIGSKIFKGSEIRSLFSLRSSAFSIKEESGNVVFTVKGYGHGVGMSQNGANLLAKEGKTYDEILKTYYSGVTLSKYEK